MAKKAEKLSDLALKKPEAPEAASPAPAPQTQEPPTMLSKPERVKNYKAMTLRLNPDAWRALRYIAHRGGRPLPAPRGFDAPGARACTHKGRRSGVLTGAPDVRL